MFTLSEQYHANFVFALIAAAALLMASHRFRFDLIAIGVVLALILTTKLARASIRVRVLWWECDQ